MFNKKYKKGFTLIELLIVIAIIGVLAATVVVSLGSQTEKAQQGSVKIGVSSIRNLATVAVVEGKVGTTKLGDNDKVCELILSQVSGEKDGWTWDGDTECKANDVNVAGEICCASTTPASGNKWVLWGAAEGKAVYCADSIGFAGNVDTATESANQTSIEEGDDDGVPVKCED